MTPAGAADPARADALTALGLQRGERVRFLRKDRSRWQEGSVLGVEADGSIAISDEKGARRAVKPDQVEVRLEGPRGARLWEPLPDRVARSEQLSLLDP